MLLDRTAIAAKDFLEKMKANLAQRLEDQGHVNTGALKNSIEVDLKVNEDSIDAGILMNDYWEGLDTGLSPAQIRGMANHEEDLFQYFRQRGLPIPDASRAAFFTNQKHLQFGSPTEGSYDFTNNGKRTGFNTDVVEEMEPDLERLLELASDEDIQNALDAIFKGLVEV